jgi:hypothetical protein
LQNEFVFGVAAVVDIDNGQTAYAYFAATLARIVDVMACALFDLLAHRQA